MRWIRRIVTCSLLYGCNFTGNRNSKKSLEVKFESLSRCYDVMVANSLYLGSGNMNGWLLGWVKESQPGLNFFILPAEYEITLFGTSGNVVSSQFTMC